METEKLRKEISSLQAKLTEAEKSRDEALEALGMSSKRNGQLSDRVKELELEEPSLRAANECNRKCLAQLAKAEEVILFYADKTQYEGGHGLDGLMDKISYDEGKRARAYFALRIGQ